MSKTDPAGVSWLIRKFSTEFTHRFSWFGIEARKYILEYLGLPYTRIAESANTIINAETYNYPRSDEKVVAFLRWAKEMEVKGILTTRIGPGQTTVGDQRWTDKYIEASYKKGMADAYAYGGYEAVSKLTFDQWFTASFYLPIHADRVGLLYTRTFNELEGVTNAMDQSMSRVLAQGMSEGKNPKKIARNLVAEVKDIGIRRANLIAHTEIMRAHAEGSLNTYESFAEEGVSLRAEILNAGDDKVCSRCLALSTNPDGSTRVYILSEARGLIPKHPACRCCWLALTEDLKGENRLKQATSIIDENIL